MASTFHLPDAHGGGDREADDEAEDQLAGALQQHPPAVGEGGLAPAQARISGVVHELLRGLPGPAMPYHSTACGWPFQG
jgi:hypothetical protein